MITIAGWELVFLGGLAAGALNALAGGGTFFSFPALLAAGLPPVTANATNSVALWPASLAAAWAYRAELRRYALHLRAMALRALAGGAIGALLLLVTDNQIFTHLIPWLLLIATLLFAIAPHLTRLLAARCFPLGKPSKWRASLFQVLVAIYGGFFGAGMGIMLMAAIAIEGVDEIHEIQALKNLLSAAIYSVSAITFLISGLVSWPHLLVTTLAAALGGYGAGYLARRIAARWLRRFVLFIATAITCYYFVFV